MKPTSLLLCVMVGIGVAIWWVFIKNTSLSSQVQN